MRWEGLENEAGPDLRIGWGGPESDPGGEGIQLPGPGGADHAPLHYWHDLGAEF